MSAVSPTGVDVREPLLSPTWAAAWSIIDVMAIGLARDTAAIGSARCPSAAIATPDAIGEREMTAGTPVPAAYPPRSVSISRLAGGQDGRAATALESALDTTERSACSWSPRTCGWSTRTAPSRRRWPQGDPLRVRAGSDGRVAGGVGVALGVAVDRAARDAAGDIGGHGLGRAGARPRRHRTGAACHAAAPDPLSGLPREAVAAIFLAPAMAPRPAPIAAVAALFDLTPTETRVLELITAGRSNADVAAALGTAVSTVRTHLLHLFAKTRTHRQTELVALVASFSLPIAAG